MTLEGFIFYWIVIGAIILTLALLESLMGKWRTARPGRERPRIPARERELLGDDYRDVIEDYFSRKAERDERRERAIRGR